MPYPGAICPGSRPPDTGWATDSARAYTGPRGDASPGSSQASPRESPPPEPALPKPPTRPTPPAPPAPKPGRASATQGRSSTRAVAAEAASRVGRNMQVMGEGLGIAQGWLLLLSLLSGPTASCCPIGLKDCEARRMQRRSGQPARHRRGSAHQLYGCRSGPRRGPSPG